MELKKNNMLKQSTKTNSNIDVVGEIKNRLDIVETVSEHVVLKKSGRNHWGCCPFHKEKTPSFSVNHEKGIYKCFGCGEGGDAISFLMKVNNNSFHEVIVELAEKYGIDIPAFGYSSEKTELKNELYKINEIAVQFYKKNLIESPEAEIARTYLSQRNITEETINTFNIGFAPNSYDALINHFSQHKISIQMLDKAGLVSQRTKGNGFLDRFRNRIMVPIQDEKGNFIAFGARALDDSNNPKYLNSPETLVFNKSRSLFALHQAKETIKAEDSVILMEGFFDVISAHAHGLHNVVATLGTALSESHIKIIARYSNSRRIFLAFDSDEAGVKATNRGAEIIKNVFAGLGDVKQFDENFTDTSAQNVKSSCEIRVVNNVNGKDPDEFIRNEGIEAYKKVVNQSPLLIDYQINRIIQSTTQIESPQEKAKLINALIPIISEIQNTIIRNEYIKLISERLMIQEEALSFEIKKTLQRKVVKSDFSNNLTAKTKEEPQVLAQKNLLGLYFLNNEKLSTLCINNYLKEVMFTDEVFIQIKQEIQKLIQEDSAPESLSDELLTRFAEDETAKKTIVDIMCSLDDKQHLEVESLKQYIKDHLIFIKRHLMTKTQKQLKADYYASNKDEENSITEQKKVQALIMKNKINTDDSN